MISNRTRRFFFAVLSVNLLAGCAAPRPISIEQEAFISTPQLKAVGLTQEGLSLLAQQRYSEAEGRFRKALYIQPHTEPLERNLAGALEGGGLYDEAREIYNRLLVERPGSPELLASLARVNYRAGDTHLARGQYEKALELALKAEAKSQASDIARSLAVLHFMAGDEARALCLSHDALEYRPDSDSVVRHVRLLLSLGRNEAAEVTVRSFIGKNFEGKDPMLLHQLALAMLAQGKIEDALETERMALSMPSTGVLNRSELELVERLATPADESPDEEDDEDVEDTLESDRLLVENLAAARMVSSESYLYWPAPVLVAADRFAEEIEAKEEE